MPRIVVMVALVSSLGPSHRALAQQIGSTTAAIFRPPVFADAGVPTYPIYLPDRANQLNRVPTAHVFAESANRALAEEHKHLWPEFALGVALAGGVAVGAYGLLNCDQNCQDDGALGHLPPLMLAGAFAGAAAGAMVGLIVDSSRSAGP